MAPPSPAVCACLQKRGKVKHVGATNFDVQRMREMSEAGVRIVNNQASHHAALRLLCTGGRSARPAVKPCTVNCFTVHCTAPAAARRTACLPACLQVQHRQLDRRRVFAQHGTNLCCL